MLDSRITVINEFRSWWSFNIIITYLTEVELTGLLVFYRAFITGYLNQKVGEAAAKGERQERRRYKGERKKTEVEGK